jgi:hypothetical protein
MQQDLIKNQKYMLEILEIIAWVILKLILLLTPKI